jgi:hypothetical protein
VRQGRWEQADHPMMDRALGGVTRTSALGSVCDGGTPLLWSVVEQRQSAASESGMLFADTGYRGLENYLVFTRILRIVCCTVPFKNLR